MDYRWILDDSTKPWVKASVFSDNQVLLTLPAMDYGLLKDQATLCGFPDHINAGLTNGRASFNEDAKEGDHRIFKKLMLTFPFDNHLSSSEIYTGAGEDKKLQLIVGLDAAGHTSVPNTTNAIYYYGFQIANRGEEGWNTADTRSNGASDAAQAMAALAGTGS